MKFTSRSQNRIQLVPSLRFKIDYFTCVNIYFTTNHISYFMDTQLWKCRLNNFVNIFHILTFFPLDSNYNSFVKLLHIISLL